MKMQIKILLIILFIIIRGSFNKINCQSTTLGHFVPGFPAFNWCGWDAATPIPFNLEHRGTADINFLLGGTQYATIKGTGFLNPGFVGIGNGFTTPRSLLHIHDGAFSYLQVTNVASGNGAFQGVRFGLFGPTAHAVVAQQNPNNLYFVTAGAAASPAGIRMSVVGLAGPTQGFCRYRN